MLNKLYQTPKKCSMFLMGQSVYRIDQVNNNIRFDPLHCVSWDFHPIFGWILSLISEK